jgi:hypothetical protein
MSQAPLRVADAKSHPSQATTAPDIENPESSRREWVQSMRGPGYLPSLLIRLTTSLRLNTEGCNFVPSPGPLGAVM